MYSEISSIGTSVLRCSGWQAAAPIGEVSWIDLWADSGKPDADVVPMYYFPETGNQDGDNFCVRISAIQS